MCYPQMELKRTIYADIAEHEYVQFQCYDVIQKYTPL